MAKFDVFVGREKELDYIHQWAEKWGTVHLVLIDGKGGIGKTFLLRKIMEKYSAQDEFAVAYYDLSEQPPGIRQILHLAESLGWHYFPNFQAQINDLASGEYDVADVRLPQLEQEAMMTFVEEANTLMEHKRIIFLTDTLDAFIPGYAEENLYKYVPLFSNALGISAGRQAKAFLPDFRKGVGEKNVTHLAMDSFSQVESRAFFAEVDKDNLISPDLRAKLHFLTDGRPILLSLSTEWLFRDVPLSDIADHSLETLRALPPAELQALRERFEFELVDQVRRLKDSQDRAVLYMAHINRRNDASILSSLLELPYSEAQDLVQGLADLSFVRYNPITGSCALHDEMRNLINKYAWPDVDPTGDLRRKLTRRIIDDYYKLHITRLEHRNRPALDPPSTTVVRQAKISEAEWEQWRLEAECLYYHLQLSEEEGFAYFDDRFQEAQRNNHLMRMQFLLSEMEIAGHADIHARVELRRAESLRRSGDTEQAREICEKALRQADTSQDSRISAYMTLGWIAAADNPEQAIDYFKTALALAEKAFDSRHIGILHNNLGLVNRFINQLDEATEHYQSAIAYSRQSGDASLVASATNNLAYVYQLEGDLAQADAMCRIALAQRKKLGVERDLAYSYLTKAEIDREKGDLESAERYTKLALRSFEKLNEVRGQVMAYRSLANIHRHLEQFDKARIYLDQALSLATQLNDNPLLASIYDVYGRHQRDHAVYLQELGAEGNEEKIGRLFGHAREYLEKSLALAQRHSDQWLLTRGQLELILAYFLSRSHSDEEIEEMLNIVWERASRLQYTLLQGYVHEIRGEIALRHKDHVTAAKQFGRSAKLLSRYTGRELTRFFDRLSEYLLNVDLAPDVAALMAQSVLDIIEDPKGNAFLESLQVLCQQVLSMQSI